MRLALLIAVAALTMTPQSVLVPTGTLRAGYIATNPAHALTDTATGTVRGTVVDLSRELAQRLKVELTLSGLSSPQAVIDAVRGGQVDIGFVAYNPERAGPVEFSQPFMLVQQTFVVSESSQIRSVTNIDQPGNRIGAVKGDSIALYLGRTLTRAQLVEVADPGEGIQALSAGKIDAFGANRQRLSDTVRSGTGIRVLPDDLYGVEQTIIVAAGKAAALKIVNEFIDDVRRSGFLASAIQRSGVVGLTVAP
jgi:polar amino acid transport system substrate-binding protein